ncbi:MAG: VWA domain-containing protein [Blastocatellia bacterium]|nr:VWA domain-containing protein [Blastocatellia bacterium]
MTRKTIITILFLSMIAGALMIGPLNLFNLFNPVIAQDTANAIQDAGLIDLDVVVKDAEGKRVPGLKKEDFEIYEDGELQEIGIFKPINQPLRLVLLLDTSTSMGYIFHGIRDESVKFVGGLNQLDEIIVASFSRNLYCPADWGGKARAENDIIDMRSDSELRVKPPQMPSPSPPRRLPSPSIGSGRSDSDTNLYGALHDIFERFGGRGGNEVVLLISDGKDSINGTEAKQRPVKEPKQIVQKAQESWVQINTACFKSEQNVSLIGIGKAKGFGSNCKFLSDIAVATGGRAFEFETKTDLNLILRKTLEEWRSQYSLAYSSSHEGKVGFHKIRAVVKRPDLVVRTREGYLVSK